MLIEGDMRLLGKAGNRCNIIVAFNIQVIEYQCVIHIAVSRETLLFLYKCGRLSLVFYRPKSTRSTLMSLGDTPGMRLACAKVSGFIADNFCLPSVEIS